jgi:hypothetical protein
LTISSVRSRSTGTAWGFRRRTGSGPSPSTARSPSSDSNPAEGALAIFTTRGAAEAFVAGYPFVVGGAVGKYAVPEWNEALA